MRLVHINEDKFNELLNVSDSLDDLEDELEKLNKEIEKVVKKTKKSEEAYSELDTDEKDTNKNIPFLTFYEEVVKFIKGLLNDPIKTKPSDILIDMGLHNGDLRKKLYDYNIISKKENIDEPFDETSGKKVSHYYVSYKVHKEQFKDKIRKLYSDLKKDLNESCTLYMIKRGNTLYPMGNAKDIIGKDKVTYDEFDFGLSQKLVKKGYKIAINGDV